MSEEFVTCEKCSKFTKGDTSQFTEVAGSKSGSACTWHWRNDTIAERIALDVNTSLEAMKAVMGEAEAAELEAAVIQITSSAWASEIGTDTHTASMVEAVTGPKQKHWKAAVPGGKTGTIFTRATAFNDLKAKARVWDQHFFEDMTDTVMGLEDAKSSFDALKLKRTLRDA